MLICGLLLLNVWPCCFTPCWLQNVRPDWERRKRERCFQGYMYRIIVWHCKTAGRWQNISGRGGNGSKIERGQQARCHCHDSDDQVNKMCLHQWQNGDHCCARKLASGPQLLFCKTIWHRLWWHVRSKSNRERSILHSWIKTRKKWLFMCNLLPHHKYIRY